MKQPNISKDNPKLYKAIKEGTYDWIKVMVDKGEVNFQRKDGLIGFSDIKELRDSVLFYIEEAYKGGNC